MRLICPNCDAEYEVDAGMIPAAGRDVQCSSCELVWFQPGAVEFDELPDTPLAPPQREMDAETRAIIDQEVAFETKARETEDSQSNAPGAGPKPESGATTDTSPALGSMAKASESAKAGGAAAGLAAMAASSVNRPDPKGSDAGQSAAKRPGADITANTKPSKPPAAPDPKFAKPDPATFKADTDDKFGRFQDVDEVNSSLADAPAVSAEDMDGELREPVVSPELRYARGYRSGFGLTLIAGAALVMAYANAPMIAQRAPQMTSGLANYVRSVDTLRVWLDGAALSLTERMSGLVESVSDNS